MRLTATLTLACLAIATQPSLATDSNSGRQRYIVVNAAAQVEVAADQMNISIQVTDEADSPAAVIEKLKQKRDKITEVSKAADFQVTVLELKQIDVRSGQRGGAGVHYGKAEFQLGMTGVKDALDAVSHLSSIEAESIGRVQHVLSPETSKRIKAELRQLTETNARENGVREAITLGQKLGDMVSFEYKENNHSLGSGQTSFTLTGRGQATFLVE